MSNYLKKDTMKITGMTCASCAKAVERAVKKIDNTIDASVNIATEKLSVSYDEFKVSPKDIQLAIEKAGYGVIHELKVNKTIIPISGMTCASCAKAVERSVGKVDGLEKVEVNFATEKASISYLPEKVKLSQIKDAIKKAGYEPLDAENKERKRSKIFMD